MAALAGAVSAASASGLRTTEAGAPCRLCLEQKAIALSSSRSSPRGDAVSLSNVSTSALPGRRPLQVVAMALPEPSRRAKKGWCHGAATELRPWSGNISERGSRGKYAVTRALPADTYWITAFQAVSVAGLMAGFAVIGGVFINIKIEREAYAEYQDLKAKGQLPDEIVIPERGDWDIEEPLYIFQAKDLTSSSRPTRDRPVREEEAPDMKPDVAAELEPASLD